MLTKHVVALLALGGEIRAWRVFPHPYHYGATLHGLPTEELTVDDVAALVAAKRVTAPHASQFGDSYGYRLNGEWARAESLMDHPNGFGVCGVCRSFPVKLNSKHEAVRHGFTKLDPTPCSGSGKVPALCVLPVSEAQAA